MKTTVDIHERVYRFVIKVINLLKTIPRNQINLNIIDQCSRSVASVGANDQEADACSSKRDFISKYVITKKELKETLYWLRLIGDINPFLKDQSRESIDEGKQILLIVSKIIFNCRNK